MQNLVKGGVIARIAGVADRTAAERLRGIELYLPRAGSAAGGRGRVLPRRSGRPPGGAPRRNPLRRGAGGGEFRRRRPAGHRPAGEGRRSACPSPTGSCRWWIWRQAASSSIRRWGCWRMARQTGWPRPPRRRRRRRREQGGGPRVRSAPQGVPHGASPCSASFPRCSPDRSAIPWPARRWNRESGRLETVDIRDFASDKHRSVDDAPFGGGPGMVMKPEVVDRAIRAAHRGPEPVVYPDPARPQAGPGDGARLCRPALA